MNSSTSPLPTLARITSSCSEECDVPEPVPSEVATKWREHAIGIQRVLLSHLAGLSLHFRHRTEMEKSNGLTHQRVESMTGSGILIEREHYTAIITAAHVVAEIRKAIESGFELIRCYLMDDLAARPLGDGDDYGVPLPSESLLSSFICVSDEDPGIDHAARLLGDLELANLRARQSRPLKPDEIRNVHAEFDIYVLMGFPAASVNYSRRFTHTQVKQKVNYGIPLLPMARVPMNEVPEHLRSKYPRFYGRPLAVLRHPISGKEIDLPLKT